MSEASVLQRKKGGRPRKHNRDAKRLSMTFRVNESLHAKIETSAQSNGRSLSEEIERLLENYFERGENMSAAAQSTAAAAATSAALSAADIVKFKIEEIISELFGGKPFLLIAKDLVDAFQKALVDTAKDLNFSSPDQISKNDIEHLTERLTEGQTKVVEDWVRRAEFARAIAKMPPETFIEAIGLMEKPEGADMRRALDERIWRFLNFIKIDR